MAASSNVHYGLSLIMVAEI